MADKHNKVQRLVAEMNQLIEAAKKDRSQWLEDTEEYYGYTMSDPTVVFGDGYTQSKESKRSPASMSQYHYPLVTEKAEAFVAAINGPDVEIRVVPKLDQDTLQNGEYVDQITRMLNAAFHSCRNLIQWNDHMHRMAKNTFIFDKHYISPTIDFVKLFPDPMPSLREYNPWQIYYTPGKQFHEACEVVTCVYVDKEELKAEFPEYADEIDAINTGTSTSDGKGTGVLSGSIRSINTGMPGYGKQDIVTDSNSIEVLERWKLDASLKPVNAEKDDAKIRHERIMLEQARTANTIIMPNGEQISPELMFDRFDRHDVHFEEHAAYIDYLDQLLMQTVAVPNDYGIVTQMPILSLPQQQIITVLKDIMTAHNELHLQALEEIPEAKIGMIPKYDGGWRQTTVLGQRIIAFDGASKFWTNHAIKGPPMEEFSMMGWTLQHWGPSLAGLLIDQNKIIDSLINSAKDNMNLFGNHSWWMTDEVAQDPDTHISNDPREPNKFPSNKIMGKDFGILDAKEIPASIFNLIGVSQNFADKVAGIMPSLSGKQESGVRSGKQTELLINQNISQLTYKMTRLKPAIERLATKWFKMVLQIPPADNYISPLIDGKAVPIDFEMLKKIDFIVDVVIQPGGSSSTEQRNSILLGMIQNFGQLFAQAGWADLLFGMLADSIKLQAPDLAAAINERVPQLQQRQAQMQQQGEQARQQELQNQQAQIAIQAQKNQTPPRGG